MILGADPIFQANGPEDDDAFEPLEVDAGRPPAPGISMGTIPGTAELDVRPLARLGCFEGLEGAIYM